jgi:hypothetical protein
LANNKRRFFSNLRFPSTAYGILFEIEREVDGISLPFYVVPLFIIKLLIYPFPKSLKKYFIILLNRFKTYKNPDENPDLPKDFKYLDGQSKSGRLY